MAPANETVPGLILANLETVLAGINGGSSYFYTVAEVQTPGFLEFTVNAYPAIVIVPEGTNDDDVEVYNIQTTRWNITIGGMLDERSGSNRGRDLLRFVADIYKAVMTDPTRGGNAVDTKWTGWTPSLPADDSDQRSWVECAIQVHFRTAEKDMTTAR